VPDQALKNRPIIRSRAQLIQNGGTDSNQSARRSALDALEGALRAVDPYGCLLAKVRVRNGQIRSGECSVPLANVNRILILAVGKAAVPMMTAMTLLLRNFRVNGILVAPKDQYIPPFGDSIEVFRSGHPVPDLNGLAASREAKRAVGMLGDNDLLICLISGGASAMLPALAKGISLQDKKKVTEELVKSRATIHEINTVRRHLSSLKGGQLVRLSRAPRILSLIVSDVPGNILPDIASGLTVEDPTTFRDAAEILQKHGLWSRVPKSVVSHLMLGARGRLPETPKPGDPTFKRVSNIIIADNRAACVAAKRVLTAKHIPTTILTSSAETEARSMGKLLAAIATATKLHNDPINKTGAIIIGGETTVEVKGSGLGGRSQETALSAVEGIAGLDGTVIAALGTDGIDGNSVAAGALVDGRTAQRAKRKRVDPKSFLTRNDSFRFFRRLNDNLITGRTGTNVGDLYLLLCKP
jgi:glycerate 2-kinase